MPSGAYFVKCGARVPRTLRSRIVRRLTDRTIIAQSAVLPSLRGRAGRGRSGCCCHPGSGRSPGETARDGFEPAEIIPVAYEPRTDCGQGTRRCARAERGKNQPGRRRTFQRRMNRALRCPQRPCASAGKARSGSGLASSRFTQIGHALLADAAANSFVDQSLKMGNLCLPLLISTNEFPNVITGVPKTPGLALLFNPPLHLFRKGNIHCRHGHHLETSDQTKNAIFGKVCQLDRAARQTICCASSIISTRVTSKSSGYNLDVTVWIAGLIVDGFETETNR